MNVLMLHGSHSEGGGDTVYINQLIQLLPSYQTGAFLMSIENEGSGYSLVVTNAGEKRRIFLKTIHDINLFIYEFCKARKVDLIHIHTLYLPEINEFCLKLLPVVKSPHSTDMVCPGTNKFFSTTETKCNIPFGTHCFRHAYTKKCCSRSPRKLLSLYSNVYAEVRKFSARYKAIVVMSDYIRDECIAAGIPNEKIRVIPYFTLPVNNSSTAELPKRLLYVGRLSQVKGVHTMIHALKPLFDQYPDLHLDIIGDGPYKKKVMDLVDHYKISHRVIFHGWMGREEVNAALEESMIVLFPSIYPEAFGISGIEAMMHSKPVVGFDVGGVHNWLKDGENGYLVPVKNNTLFREKVDLLINNSELRNRLGSRAKKMTWEKFNPREHIIKLLEVYNAQKS